MAGQCPTTSGFEMGTDHRESQVQQSAYTFHLIHQGGVDGRGSGVLDAHEPHAPPQPHHCCPLQVPLNPLFFVGSTEGNACKKLRLIETHMKLIPEWAKGVSFL